MLKGMDSRIETALANRLIPAETRKTQTSTLTHLFIIASDNYNACSTALAISAVPLLPPNSIGLIPPA